MDIVLIFKAFKNKISLPLEIGESRKQAIDPKAGAMVAEAQTENADIIIRKGRKGSP